MFIESTNSCEYCFHTPIVVINNLLAISQCITTSEWCFLCDDNSDGIEFSPRNCTEGSNIMESAVIQSASLNLAQCTRKSYSYMLHTPQKRVLT